MAVKVLPQSLQRYRCPFGGGAAELHDTVNATASRTVNPLRGEAGFLDFLRKLVTLSGTLKHFEKLTSFGVAEFLDNLLEIKHIHFECLQSVLK